MALSNAALAAAGWQQISPGPILIRARQRPNSPVRDLWAEGDLDAPVRDIQDVIRDCPNQPRFMPYMKECRALPSTAPDGSELVYSKLAPPFVEPRDYVLKVFVDRSVGADGKGEFLSRWVAQPDALAVNKGIIRIRVNEGSWHAYETNGKTHLVYRLAADPGGTLPPSIANLSNKSAVIDTFNAIEREARKRARARGAR